MVFTACVFFDRRLKLAPVIQIAFVNQKGGPGKTTVATLAALGLLDSGATVGVKDYDDQGSFLTSLQGSGAEKELSRLAECDFVIADTPGRFGVGFDESVRDSTLVVIVSGVQPLDVERLPPTYDRVKSLGAADRSVVVFNKVRSNTLFGRQNFATLAEKFCGTRIPVAPFVIPYKEAYGRIPAILWEEEQGKPLSSLVERDVLSTALRLASFLGKSVANVLQRAA